MELTFENSGLREYVLRINSRTYTLKIYSSGIFLFYNGDETWHGHENNGELLVDVKGTRRITPPASLMSLL